MATTSALALVPRWLMEPESSLGPQYQPFYISDAFGNTMDETNEVPHYARFHTSSARNEPLPTPQSATVSQTQTSTVKFKDVLEADRLSKVRFEGIFADIDTERAERRVREARQMSYTKYEPVTSYPIETGVIIEDSRHLFGKSIPPEFTDYVVDQLLNGGARRVYNSEYPPVATFLKKLNQNPHFLQVTPGKGRNVREWTTVDLPNWYTPVITKESKVPLIDRVCFVVAALWVYDQPEHPAHRLFWSNLTCRAQSGTDEKQSVWERTTEIVQRLLDLKHDCPVDYTNRDKFAVDIWGLQQLTGQDKHTRIKQLFPTRWVPELGPEGPSGDVLPNGPRTKKRKAEAPPATEQLINTGAAAAAAASPRKRTRVISFAELPRKSSRVAKAKMPETPVHEDRAGAVPPSKHGKTAKLRSVLKKTNLPGKQTVTVVTTKTKTELMVTTITTPPPPSPPDSPARPKRSLSERKANATLPPLTSKILPNPSSLNLVTSQSLSRSTSAESGFPGSSTAVSPTSGDSRGSSTSAGTAVESPAMDANNSIEKRKRTDEGENVDSKVTEAEEVLVPRRTTRTRATKLTAKAAAAISNAQPVEDKASNQKRRKTTNSPRKK